MIRKLAKTIMSAMPGLDGAFRRHVWSRVHFSEIELRLLDRLPPGSFDLAVDVGAALGSYSWVLARKSRRVIAYEPGQRNGAFLEVATRGSPVELVRAAVGAEAGELNLFTAGTADSSVFTATLSLQNPISSAQDVVVNRVPVVGLDEDLSRRMRAGERLDLLKIDVEGFENAVIEGGLSLIAAHHPLIICEIEARHNPRNAELFGTLQELGYSTHFWARGSWHPLQGDIAALQDPNHLEGRMSGSRDAEQNDYINNFIFQHPQTRSILAPRAGSKSGLPQ